MSNLEYFNQYSSLIEEAKASPSQLPGETHHIIPRSVHKRTPSAMAVNAPENLVFLSHRQHLKAHWLLFKMYEGTEYAGSMSLAFVMMINQGKSPEQPTAEQYQDYEEAKIAANKTRSERQTGKNNSMFGRTGEKNPMFGRTGEKSPMFGKGYLISGERHPNFGKTGEEAPMFGRTGEKHPRFGKPRPEGSGVPMRPVINTATGEVWESLNECGRQLGVSGSAIRLRIKNGTFGGIWQHVEAA